MHQWEYMHVLCCAAGPFRGTLNRNSITLKYHATFYSGCNLTSEIASKYTLIEQIALYKSRISRMRTVEAPANMTTTRSSLQWTEK